jgi:membrane dipeptidase
MQLFDAHLDMAWNALEWNRELKHPVSKIREIEAAVTDRKQGDPVVSWVELRRGQIGTVIATLLPRLRRPDQFNTFYQSREAAYAASCGQLAYYRALVKQGYLREILDWPTLEAHVAEWNAPAETTPIGFILSMEGSWSVLEPEMIEEWYDAGLRILGPAHYGPDEYCHGTGSRGGLKQRGPELLRQMERVGMILDATHLSDQSFWEALDIYTGPVLASHHNCRALVDADRQLTDDQIQALIERRAVIGAAFDNWMINPGWVIGVSDPQTVVIQDILKHIDHICQLAGNSDHCGIGSDLDGGFGKEQCPSDLDSIADLRRLIDLLQAQGYSDDDVEKIMFRNWVDFFRRAWTAR